METEEAFIIQLLQRCISLFQIVVHCVPQTVVNGHNDNVSMCSALFKNAQITATV